MVAADGDGVSGESTAVPDLIASWNPGMFLYLGDVYEDGTYTEFYNWYGSGANYYSRFRSITNPTVGNHEYTNGEAPGYFKYWNNPPSYYSFDTAGWHFISLNSNIPRDMGVEKPEYSWLARDLAQNASQCTLAYMHAPRYSIGSEGGTEPVAPMWALLVNNQADIFLTGHDHNYQRWQPLDASGNFNPEGITQFVVGSGGHGIRPFVSSDTRMVKGIDDVQETPGALRLQLYSDRATFEYINAAGLVLDSGEIPCHKAISNFTFHVPSFSTANLRDCPATNCSRIKSLSPGTQVIVLSQVTGEVVSGSAIWYEVSVDDLHGYIHSSLLIGTPQ
ncbi:MAG: metallophosphoesterase [Anaerolineae bacterium]|nr:metallophosphoesterase [Anaerolineae bacterium]